MAPVPIWLLAKAAPKDTSSPITSPVERISGPRWVSTPGKRLKGSTASFTARCPGSGPVAASPTGSRPASRRSASRSPAITRAATFASATPVAFDVKGTVRLARGFASSTNGAPSRSAYWTLMSPRVRRAPAIASVASRKASTCARPRV